MNLHRKVSLSFICIALLHASLLEAKEELEPIVVTSSKTDSNIKDISIATEVITAEQIKHKGATRLRDILKFRVGMYKVPGGGISIRGLDSRSNTLVLVDGKRLTGEGSSSMEIDRIDISNVERIEITRGAGGLYGIDGFGGVINVIMKKSDKFSGTITPQYGVFGGGDGVQKSISFSSNIPVNDKLTASLSGSIRDYERLDDDKKNSIQTDGQVKSIGLGINYKLNEQDTIGFDADYMSDKGDNFMKNDVMNLKNDNERQNYSLSWNHKDDSYDSLVRVYKSIYDKGFEVYNTKKNKLMKFVIPTRETSVAEAQVNFLAVNKHLLSIGAELRKEYADKIYGGTSMANETITEEKYKGVPIRRGLYDVNFYMAFIQDQWEVNDKFSLVASLRYDDSDTDELESGLSPKVGLIYSILEEKNLGLRFKTNYTNGFESPSVSHFSDTINDINKMIIKGNPKLTTEEFETYDISLEGEYNDFFAKMSYFHNDVDGLIDKVFTGVDPDTQYKIFSYKNLDDVTIDGFELEISYELSDSYGISANYTFLDAKGDISYGPAPKKLSKSMKLEDRPRHLANINAHYIYNPWNMKVNFWGEYVGDMLLNYKRDEQNNITGKNEKSYTLLYVSITKEWSKDIEVYAGVDNILDKTDDEVPLLGAFGYVGMRYKF